MYRQQSQDPQPPHGSPPPHDPRPPRDPPPRGDSRRAALLGLLVTVLLIVIGLILIRVLGNAGRMQDCVMSGRTNCAPIDSSQPP